MEAEAERGLEDAAGDRGRAVGQGILREDGDAAEGQRLSVGLGDAALPSDDRETVNLWRVEPALFYPTSRFFPFYSPCR